MIYLNSHDTTMVTVNGTTSTDFSFTNNQSQQTYNIDLWTVGLNTTSNRKQITFMLQWDETPADPPTNVSDGVNYIHVPSGEYNYSLGDVKGLMKLVDPVSEPTTYENNDDNSIIYNG